MNEDSLTIDSIWGGTIKSYEVDLFSGDISMIIDISSKSECLLSIMGISQIHIENNKLEDWNYAELTSIEVKSKSIEGIELGIEIWSTFITFKCRLYNIEFIS